MFSTSFARSQEILLTGPLAGACAATLVHDATPARWELAAAPQLGVASVVGSGHLGETWVPAVGLGVEATTSLFTYSGFPSWPGYGAHHSRAELRAGPWVLGSLRGDEGLLEGGLKLQLGGVYHASWGTFDLRAGAGRGAAYDRQRSHLSLTLGYGVYSAVGRYSQRGHCDPKPRPAGFGYASVARLFVTHRRAMEPDFASALGADPALYEWVVGIELSPSFLFAPLEWMRLAGGPPQTLPWSEGAGY